MTLYHYTLRMADNSLILGHRLSEWCGHGPVLEQDIAVTNIALDLVGQARNFYELAASIQNKGKTEDDLAFLREEFEYQNLLLAEQPNGDFAHTVVRQFFFSAFQLPFYEALQQVLSVEFRVLGDTDRTQNAKPTTRNSKPITQNLQILRGIIEKAIKEVRYHLRWSSEWMIRLGDGTAESHKRMQEAVNNLYPFTFEAFIVDDIDQIAINEGYGVDLEKLKPIYDQTMRDVLAEANLQKLDNGHIQKGGKQGIHTEHLGYLLAEMQYLQRTYPNSKW